MTQPEPLPPVPGFTDLRSRIQAGETLFGTFLQLGSAVAAELVARVGFDWVIIDLEHGSGTEADLPGSLVAVGTTPTAALVRPQSAERIRIGRALDHGAHGLMIPRIDVPEQAREAISFMRYPPQGVRGLALSTRGAGLGERAHADVAGINASIVGIIQVESPSAVEHAAEIAAIDGVDVLFVGPADLTHSLGIPGQFDHPDYLAAIQRTACGGRSARQGHRHPDPRRDRPPAPPRARLPVRRDRIGRRVHRRRRACRRSRHPGLMARRVAFLRAVNVGGHTIRMADLRASFEKVGFEAVETFIASGNVLFDSAETDDEKLERVIERALEAEYGYPIETFVRSMKELAVAGRTRPVRPQGSRDDGRSVFVAFLGRRPTPEAVKRLVALATDDDTFAVVGREAYWLRRGGIGTSRFSAGFLEKTLGMPATLRGLPTITKLLAKFG